MKRMGETLIGSETDWFVKILNHTRGISPMSGPLPMLSKEPGKYILEWHFLSGPVVREEFSDVLVNHLIRLRDKQS